MDELQQFFDKEPMYYRGEDDSSPNDFETAKFKWLWDKNPITGSVLEIGCANGTFYQYLRGKGMGKNWIGVDSNIYSKRVFKTRFPEAENQIISNDILNYLKKTQNKFDCIVAFEVLEHLPDEYLLETIKEIKEHLKENGSFLVSVPCGESLTSFFHLYIDLTHKRCFIPRNFETLGFKIIAQSGKIIPLNSLANTAKWIHNRILYWINRFVFATSIGRKKELGVFSDELVLILQPKGENKNQ